MNQQPLAQFIGIEIGGTKLQLVTGNNAATIGARARYLIDAKAGAKGIRVQMEEGIKKLMAGNNICAIGVGFGGPVNWKTGAIQLSHQIDGWAGFNLKTWLNKLTGLPVAVDNDANAAALAEAMYGAGKHYSNVFYMTIGSGIGGGMIINEKVYHGRIPGEVEIGHLRLDKNGTTLENRCSGWAVNERVSAHITTYPASQLALLAQHHSGPRAALLQQALAENDPDAGMIIHDIADDISLALSHVVHLFNPGCIIIGGGLSLLGEHIRLPISQRLPSYVMNALLPVPPINIAVLSEDAVPVGALALARQLYMQSSTTNSTT